MRLLVLSDTPELGPDLLKRLRDAGYAVDFERGAAGGLETLAVEDYDLAIVDMGLPGTTCARLIPAIRDLAPHLGILAVGQSGEGRERVLALDLGSDDYLARPVDYGQLLAIVRALLRRTASVRELLVTCGELALDAATRSVWKGKRPIQLSAKEFAVLEYLMRRCGEVVSQQELLAHVWDAQVDPITNVLPVHINSLRRRLGDDAERPRFIQTVRGMGYRAMAGVAESPESH